MFGKKGGQELSRRYETFVDQHRRFYGANVDITTGDPCEVIVAKGWIAPIEPVWARRLFMPPMDDTSIVTMVDRAHRAEKGYQIFIDYAKWLEKWDDRAQDFQKKMVDYARGIASKGDTTIAELLANPTVALLREVGRGPMPPREFIEAMAANNKWALGQSNAIPKKALALLDTLKPLIVAGGRRGGPVGQVDPFEDEDDNDSAPITLANVAADPFEDDLDELEEQFDPQATGGTRVAVKTNKPTAGKAKAKTKKED